MTAKEKKDAPRNIVADGRIVKRDRLTRRVQLVTSPFLYERAKADAEAAGLSMNAYINLALQQASAAGLAAKAKAPAAPAGAPINSGKGIAKEGAPKPLKAPRAAPAADVDAEAAKAKRTHGGGRGIWQALGVE